MGEGSSEFVKALGDIISAIARVRFCSFVLSIFLSFSELDWRVAQ